MAETKRGARKLSKTLAVGYIGLVCGRPHFDMSEDSYGTLRSADLFKKRGEARARYEDVRKVKIVEDKRP